MQDPPPAPTEYSASVYSAPDESQSPDRPATPSSFDCYIISQGGRSSTADLRPTSLQQGKHERLTEGEEYKRAVYSASLLRAETVWLRAIREAALSLHEGTIEPAIETLALGADQIQSSLMSFHFAFNAVEHALLVDGNAAASATEATLQELLPVFEACRAGLDQARRALQSLQDGSRAFSRRVDRSNRSHARLFGINYEG